MPNWSQTLILRRNEYRNNFRQVSIVGKQVNNSASLIEIETHMRKIVAGTYVPYEAGLEIWKIAMSEVKFSPDIMHPFWLIWGSLTDWVENRPMEKIDAENAMVRASNEWLHLDQRNPTVIKEYCDRWVYDELGYQRPLHRSSESSH